MMKPGYYLSALLFSFLFIINSCKNSNTNSSNNQTDKNQVIACEADVFPVIDGINQENFWSKCSWDSLNEPWIGNRPSPADFSGRYKVAWKDSFLFIYAEIIDDSLVDNHPDPLKRYWDDDCLEVFIDEDNSGGDHQFNHNAWAYHINPLMSSVDIGPDKMPKEYNSHVQGAILIKDSTYHWEVAIKIYNENYNDSSSVNRPVQLIKNQTLGFSLAYCDNDTSLVRENFMGSVNSEGHYNDQGWINADCFGKLVLQ